VTPGSAPSVASVTTPLIVASDVCAFATAGIHAGVTPAIESNVRTANRARMNTFVEKIVELWRHVFNE
jgi:hypothetical protein